MSDAHRSIRPVAALTVAFILALPAAAVGSDPQLQASSGSVTATLSYTEPETEVKSYADLALTISRAGATVADGLAPPDGYDLSLIIEPKLAVRDLDGDGDPEAIIDTFTGGAYCCFQTAVARFTGKGYEFSVEPWGEVGYRLRRLDGDRKLEFVSADDRFRSAFSEHATSGYPLEIWGYLRGAWKLKTTRYPKLVAHDARRWLRLFKRNRGRTNVRGYLSAYAADLCSIGHCKRAFRLVRHASRAGDFDDGYPGSGRYPAKLERFLRRYGYLTERGSL